MIEVGWRRAPGLTGVDVVDARAARELPPALVLGDFLVGHYVEGAVELWRPGGSSALRAGQVLVASPGDVVRVVRRHAPRGRLRALLVTSSAMARALAGVDGAKVPMAALRVVAAGRVPAASAAMLAALDGDGEPLAVQSAFVELAAALAGVDDDAAAATIVERGVVRVRDKLHDELGRAIPLDELADVAQLSKFHLVRRFTAAYGLPPHRYHLQLRLERARMRLAAGARIADVVDELGFADQSHLTRRFSRVFGISPARYRARVHAI